MIILCLTLISGTALGANNNEERDKRVDSLKIAVISDLHYFAPELGTSGAAFEEYLNFDRKLIAESSEIAKAAIEEIKNSSAEIILISGDLTKDGEKLSHEQVAALLSDLEAAGKKVYVTPGNHDINNPQAMSYAGDNAIPVDYVTPKEFKKLYKDFGYSEARAKDPNSLSYVVEPVKGLWLISMDACQYNTNVEDGNPKIAGAFSAETLEWLEEQIEKGCSQGKKVIGMSHHGIVEHFQFQNELFDEYVIDGTADPSDADDWKVVADKLADAGMQAVFTGHFHANDIVKYTTDKNKSIYDIETGSLVTYPNSYRLLELTPDNEISIQTHHIEAINYDTGNKTFPVYAQEFLRDGLEVIVENTLVAMMAKGSADPAVINAIKAQINAELVAGTGISIKSIVVDAMADHYYGDESADTLILPILNQMLANESTRALAAAILSIYNDPLPADNDVELQL